MKRTPREKKELRIRICLNIVILLLAALLTYRFVLKEYMGDGGFMQQDTWTMVEENASA